MHDGSSNGSGGGYPPGAGYPPPQGGYPPPQGYPPQGYPPQGYPPQGYPPQGYPPPGYPPDGYPGTPRRSAIPKVMGILMIVFSGIALLATLANMVKEPDYSTLPSSVVEQLQSFSRIDQLTGLVVSLIHLIAGILCVMYRRVGRLLANVYGVAATIRVIVVMTMLYGWLAPILERLPLGTGENVKSLIVAAMIFGSVLSMVWPILIFILMNLKGAREACVK